MQFVDEIKLNLKAGNGGNGIVSWRREANVPLGGPYGGDGGNGGDIIAIGDHNLNTLFEWRNHKMLRAQNGENGRTAQETGKGGENTYLKLPLGTSIYNAQTNELIVDILESGQTFVVCEGGKGGRGNTFFKSSFNRAPTLHENGDAGQELDVVLKLRYIADIGMVGLPNAGKSTFIGQVSNAKPKVANYEFTTLTPVLGVVNLHDKKVVFSDLPGLIEGASEGKGLGHEFLKHIERCHILIHLISLSPADNQDIKKAYQTINDELEKYDASLMDKPIITVANKIDVKEAKENLKKLSKFLKRDIISISAKENIGVQDLLEVIYKEYIKVEKSNQIKLQNQVQKVKVIELKKQKDYSTDLKIKKVNDNTWEVDSEYMKYWTNKIPLDTKDNIVRYNQKMETIHVEEKAKKLGANVGDTLLIYGNEFTVDK